MPFVFGHSGTSRLGRWINSIAVALLVSFAPQVHAALGASISLEWDFNPDDQVAGYAVYSGLISGVPTSRVDAGTNTTATLTGLTPGQKYYITVVSYDHEGVESEPPAPVIHTVEAIQLLLRPPSDMTVAEGSTLSFTPSLTVAPGSANSPLYTLLGAPAGMTINASTGKIQWTPSEAQGPSSWLVTLAVTDLNAPLLGISSQTFKITVAEVNQKPVLNLPAGPLYAPQSTLFTANAGAVDGDLPANALTYRLLSAPAGMTINSVTGIILWTPTSGQSGSTNTVTVEAKDNGSPAQTDTRSFVVLVNKLNRAPALAAPASRSINEGSPLSVSLSATDADLPNDKLKYSLVTAPAGMTINQDTGVIAWTPTEAQGPSANTVTVKVTDSGSPALSDTEIFVVTVNEVNVAPVLAPLADQTAIPGSPFSLKATATDADLPANVLTYSLASAPLGMLINPLTGDILWTPTILQAPGVIPVTVRVADSGTPSLAATRSFNITVRPFNYAPAVSRPANVTMYERVATTTAPQNVSVTGINPGAGNVTGQSVTSVKAVSSNPDLLPHPAVRYQTGDTSATLELLPAKNANGTATVTITVQDNGGTANGGADTVTTSFAVTIKPVNSAPTMGPLATAHIVLQEDSDSVTRDNFVTGLSTGAADEASQTLSFAYTNSNPGLFKSLPSFFRSTVDPSVATLRFDPAPNASGTAIITLRVRDNGGVADNGLDMSEPQTFTVTVVPVNDPPTGNSVANQTIMEDATATVTLSGISAGPANESGQDLTFSIQSDNPAVLPAPTIKYVRGETTAQLLLVPARNASGTARVTLTLTDNGTSGLESKPDFKSITQAFTVTINSANDAPTFTAGASLMMDVNTPMTRVPGWATDISTGAANETGQTVTFQVSNNNPALFAFQPTLGSTGELAFQPAAGATGNATLTITLRDNAGGISAAKTARISVLDDLIVANRGGTQGSGSIIRVKPVSGVQSVVALNFYNPYGLTVQSNGTIVVADYKTFPSKRGSVFYANNGGPVLASASLLFASPIDVACESTGMMVVADADADGGVGVLIRLNPITGAPVIFSRDYLNLTGMALAKSGWIYVTDGGNGTTLAATVTRVSPVDGSKTVISSGGWLIAPAGITEDPANGDLVVVDAGSRSLIRINRDTGAQSLISYQGLFQHPNHVTVDELQDFIVTDDAVDSAQVLRVKRDGSQSVITKGGNLTSPTGVAKRP